MHQNIPEINRNIAAMADDDVKITYVLGLMVREQKISTQDKAYVKQGLITNDPSFHMLRQLVQLKDDYFSISQYVLMFLNSKKQESPQENPIDFSPDTLNLMDNATEDTSPIDKIMIHRKIKQQMNHMDNGDLKLM